MEKTPFTVYSIGVPERERKTKKTPAFAEKKKGVIYSYGVHDFMKQVSRPVSALRPASTENKKHGFYADFTENKNKKRRTLKMSTDNTTMKHVSMDELDNTLGGIRFKFFSVEKCPDCSYSEFMLCDRKLKVCPKCKSTRIRRVFGI